jgi:hypothetical protein
VTTRATMLWANIFEVMGKAKKGERVAVARNLKYTLVRATTSLPKLVHRQARRMEIDSRSSIQARDCFCLHIVNDELVTAALAGQ